MFGGVGPLPEPLLFPPPGGDPKSISFCVKAGLNYVSCSPYRVPVARLAAAQAELSK